MSLIKLTIKGLSYSQTQSGAYALVLSEEEGSRTLPIIIGAFEAQSIAVALEKEIRPPRPLTHDLFKTFADKFFIDVKHIIIYKLVDGVFFSSIVCKHNGMEEVIDSRTSDAIALSVRFDVPIYTYENILEKAGIYISTENFIDDDLIDEVIEDDFEMELNGEFSYLSLKDLQNKLNNAVADENYELAAKIRDEIEKRH
ncbi:MAG: bifunctional nuclease family protein [Tenacibaculum sp.]|nr:bifunctional nuclease family protein [Tenacibaculum sp.]